MPHEAFDAFHQCEANQLVLLSLQKPKKMTEKVQNIGENHHTVLFHHGLVKIIVRHQLA